MLVCTNRKNALLLGFAALAVSLINVAQAQSTPCDAAPYTVRPDKYPALIAMLTNMFGKPNTKLIASVCKQKLAGGDRSGLHKLGFTDEQIDTTETDRLVVDVLRALRQVARATMAEEDDDSRIYALFMCVRVTGQCQMQGAPRMTFGGPMPGTFYRNNAECQEFARQISARSPTEDGRFPIGVDGNLWYECRSKHVDTWEPAQ